MDREDMVDRLCENYTSRDLLGFLDNETLGHLYDTVARLEEWDEGEEE